MECFGITWKAELRFFWLQDLVASWWKVVALHPGLEKISNIYIFSRDLELEMRTQVLIMKNSRNLSKPQMSARVRLEAEIKSIVSFKNFNSTGWA